LHAPENTLANFRACLELRLGFEFDVQRTKDGALVCIHDDTLERTTNGSGRVPEQTLADIRKLDAGSWFDRKFAGETVPTIDEVLQLIAEHRNYDVLIAVDLKADDVEADVVKLAEKHRVLQRLLFIGRTITEPQVRKRIKQTSATARTATVANNPGEFPGTLVAPDTDWVYFRFIPSAEQIEAVHRASKSAFIAGATVSGSLPENWQQAVQSGLDGILTDYPLELQGLLRQPPK
jgi:glycerophosphoryl diester phosphodiesterase